MRELSFDILKVFLFCKGYGKWHAKSKKYQLKFDDRKKRNL